MANQRDTIDPDTQIFLDRLGVTLDDLRVRDAGPAKGAVPAVEPIEWAVAEGRRRWPFPFPFPAPPLPAAWWRVNPSKLNEALDARFSELHRRTQVGYCYMLAGKGVYHTGIGGAARLPADGDVRWHTDVRMNCGSVSKFVTAIAIIRLLDEVGVDEKDSIIDKVPAYWEPPLTIARVSYRQLLRHEAGIGRSLNPTPLLDKNSGPGDFATAADQVGRGSTNDGRRDYKNLNYVVLRTLFATLLGLDPTVSLAFVGISDPDFWDRVSALAYADYVNDKVFAPAGIAPRKFDPDPRAALAYATPPKAPGDVLGLGKTGCGSSEWQLSVEELVKLMNALRRGAIIPADRARELLSNGYGVEPFGSLAGPIYGKGGREIDPTRKRVVDSAIYLMPGGLNLAIYVNSPRPPALSGIQPTTPRLPPSYLDPIQQMIFDAIEFGFF